MSPLYSINDEPPCTPLIIVKRVAGVKPYMTRLRQKEKGVHLHPLDRDFAPPMNITWFFSLAFELFV